METYHHMQQILNYASQFGEEYSGTIVVLVQDESDGVTLKLVRISTCASVIYLEIKLTLERTSRVAGILDWTCRLLHHMVAW